MRTDETDGSRAETAGFAVPADGPAATCPRCSQPFTDDEALALHLGRVHAGTLSATERDAFEDALAAETAWLRRFRLKALGGLVVLYFGLLMVYALV